MAQAKRLAEDVIHTRTDEQKTKHCKVILREMFSFANKSFGRFYHTDRRKIFGHILSNLWIECQSLQIESEIKLLAFLLVYNIILNSLVTVNFIS